VSQSETHPGALLYPQRDMARKKWESNDQFPSGNADVRHLLKKKSRSEITDAISGSFSEDKTKAKEIQAKAEKIRMDDLRGWQRLADSLRLHPTKPKHPSEGRPEEGA